MRRVCIGVYFSSNPEGLGQTVAHLQANTPRTAALLLLVDAPDPVARLELRAFSDVLQLCTAAWEGPAACFNRLIAASSAEALVFVESGTIVPAGWLEGMLATLDADAKNGLVLAGNVEADGDNTGGFSSESPLILVGREVVRAVGTADPHPAKPVQWISDYCQRARGAGFGIACVDIDTQYMHRRTGKGQAQTFARRSRSLVPEKALIPPSPSARPRLATYGVRHHRQVSREPASLTVAAHFNVFSGYGSMSEYLVRSMSRAGANVNAVPLSLKLDGLSQEFRNLLHRSRKVLSDPALFYSWPEAAVGSYYSRPEFFIYTMWESTRLPDGWASAINRARAAIVPSKFVARMFRESGVTVPIEVVPDGVDPDVYYYVDRPEKAGITTLTVGPIDNRKNVRTGIAAWKAAFANDPDARLIIKTQYNYQNYVPDDPRIRYVDAVENTRGILHWYQQADVLLALGSEGFGLPLIEGMATGLPVIALSSEGQGDVCEDAQGLLLPVPPARWETFHSHSGPFGVHGVPAVEEVADRLRWVATHRDEAREMGRAASKWVLKYRDVWAKGPAVLEAIELHSHSPLAFRRSTVLWVPSWQSPCGIAEYTAHLREFLPGPVKVQAHEPAGRGPHLIHIQHQAGIFDQSRVLSVVRAANYNGVPVVVTEHTVEHRTREWEQHATALVALNTLGVATLKARWPAKRIEYIPHGCPTWFPPRKSKRGMVIGAFGFLAPHKGFWQLLDILRQVPGAELLLFAVAKSPEIEVLWEDAAEGLPVRRIREYLPAAEIAHRLAAEADLLAYWYDEVPHYSASGAVRIGLATGVPVLASPTSWFHDLRDVTHQPRSLADGVRQLLDDTELRENLSAQARSYCHENSWPRVAAQHLLLWKSLTENK